jgi:hypothetical protein
MTSKPHASWPTRPPAPEGFTRRRRRNGGTSGCCFPRRKERGSRLPWSRCVRRHARRSVVCPASIAGLPCGQRSIVGRSHVRSLRTKFSDSGGRELVSRFLSQNRQEFRRGHRHQIGGYTGDLYSTLLHEGFHLASTYSAGLLDSQIYDAMLNTDLEFVDKLTHSESIGGTFAKYCGPNQ